MIAKGEEQIDINLVKENAKAWKIFKIKVRLSPVSTR
jgi:hypothetical protein